MRIRSFSVPLLLALLAPAVPAGAQVSLVGDWSSRVHEDSTNRVQRFLLK